MILVLPTGLRAASDLTARVLGEATVATEIIANTAIVVTKTKETVAGRTAIRIAREIESIEMTTDIVTGEIRIGTTETVATVFRKITVASVTLAGTTMTAAKREDARMRMMEVQTESAERKNKPTHPRGVSGRTVRGTLTRGDVIGIKILGVVTPIFVQGPS